MSPDIHLTHDPILVSEWFQTPEPGDGARIFFSGHIRDLENNQKIQALIYEAYEPMAEKELERLAWKIHLQHPVSSVRVVHRLGTVPVGDAAIAILVTSPHRAHAIDFVRLFMDSLKQDVPIWKVRSLP
jgi:molybdopterin synthase catalytic subunit